MRIHGLAFAFALALSAPARAELDAASIGIARPADTAAYSEQLFTLQAEPFSPASVAIDNGSYRFDYGNQLRSVLGELGWAGQLFRLGGAVSFEENLAFTTFSGQSSATGSAYSLSFLGFDTRLMYSADWFPAKWLVPFVDGGYQYTLYYQSAPTGLESASGGVGNAVAGAGARLRLTRSTSTTAFYLSLKYNRIFAGSSSIDLGSSSAFGGLSLGL
jgi:hypothetical protein